MVDPTALPRWLLVGLLLGVLGSVAVAALFVVASRLFPAPQQADSGRSGDGRRREELRAYLRAIDEAYAEDHPVAGQQVAFYLPERDVAITFDARAFYRIEGSGTTPVLVEHEMPGAQLGARLPFETPDVDFGRSVGGDGSPDGDRRHRNPTAAAFSELGVSTSATLDEIKTAYRRKVKEVHPDHGGDEEAFRRVREAYVTARQHAAD